jgi:hypothetical protein
MPDNESSEMATAPAGSAVATLINLPCTASQGRSTRPQSGKVSTCQEFEPWLNQMLAT